MAGRLDHEQWRSKCARPAGSVHAGFGPQLGRAYRHSRAFQPHERERLRYLKRNHHTGKYYILATGHTVSGSEPSTLYFDARVEFATQYCQSTFMVAGKIGTTEPLSSHGAIQHRRCAF